MMALVVLMVPVCNDRSSKDSINDLASGFFRLP